MESVLFEPAVRTEETPEALIVIVDLPGFRRKDVSVQVDDHGKLIISGERSLNEMEEITKEGGRSDTMQSGGRTFREVVSIPENVKEEDITAKFKNQVLHVSLPSVQNNHKLLTEDVNGGGKQSKQEERSKLLKQQGSMQERPTATENLHEGAKLPEVIRWPDDHKAKANESAEERRAEARKHAEDIVDGEQPISTHTQAVSTVAAGSDGDQSHLIQSKSKKRPEKHDKEFPERRIHIPASSAGPRSMFSNWSVLVVATLLVLCAAKYLSYILTDFPKSRLKH